MDDVIQQAMCIPEGCLQPLASGLWGSVYRVNGEMKVVKVAKDTADGLFEMEKKCFERLGSSDLISRYLGIARIATDKEPKPALVFEYYPLGTLKEFLDREESRRCRHDKKQQLRWAEQALQALLFIHSRHVVHGDFGIHNILVADNYDLRLGDFGGSSVDGVDMRVECSPRYHRPHSWRFPIPGVDKQTETWKIPTKVADTFALGTVLFEIFTGSQLYKGETYDEIRRHATMKDYPDLGIIELPQVRDVITKCWGEKYSSADHVLEDMHEVWAK